MPHTAAYCVQVRAHLGKDLLLGDAAYGCVLLQHADVLQVVELAEDAELGELGDAGHEDEAEVRVAGLEGAVEVAHDVAEHREGRILVDYV